MHLQKSHSITHHILHHNTTQNLKLHGLPTGGLANLCRSDEKQQLGAPLKIGDSCTFRSFRTNNYKLHFLESPSGLKVYMSKKLCLISNCTVISEAVSNADSFQHRSECGQSSRLPWVHLQQPVCRVCDEEPAVRARKTFQVSRSVLSHQGA